MTGLFLSFEGTEGSGKSTQMALLSERLTELGHSVVAVREPGGTATGEAIRELLLANRDPGPDPITEALLFAASRAQLVRECIGPSLDQGRIVLCDRYLDSSLAYQGGARGLGMDRILGLNEVAVDSCLPDLTILLDQAVELGEERVLARSGAGADRFESEARSFHESVGEHYRQLAELSEERFFVLAADGAIETIREQIWEQVEPMLGEPIL